jgi:predicted DNA-binding protein (UPF0251 family)
MMPRPFKCRKICLKPGSIHFKPAGVPMYELEDIELSLDELEAIRLADREQLYHEEAAKQMNISRQTFGNILKSAHSKIADFLLNSKSLRINGGVIEMDDSENRHFLCYDCKHTIAVPFGTNRPGKCPSCGSNNIHRHPQERGRNANGQRGKCRNSNNSE